VCVMMDRDPTRISTNLDLDAWCSILPTIDSLTYFPFPSEFCSFCLIVRSICGLEPGQVSSKEYLSIPVRRIKDAIILPSMVPRILVVNDTETLIIA
jgi:hypothetical protein